MIKLNHIIAGYGDKVVLDDICVAIDPSKITVIMGPNGCGKTTLLKTIIGLIKPMSGEIFITPPLGGVAEPSHKVAQAMRWGDKKKSIRPPTSSAGASLTPPKGGVVAQSREFSPSPRAWIQHGVFMIGQGQRVFPNMTVRDNLEIMTHWWPVSPSLMGGTCTRSEEFSRRLDEVLCHFPDLRERLDDLAGNLSGGQQQMVALSRGLLNRPRLLLLDEPSIGLAPKLISDTFHKLHEINRKTGTGFIIVEHNLKTLLPLTDRAIILANGKIVYDGASDGKTLSKMLDKIF